MGAIMRTTVEQTARTMDAGAAPLASVIGAFRPWAALRRERRALGALDARLLRDIGVSEADARIEADRPFWDAPGGR